MSTPATQEADAQQTPPEPSAPNRRLLARRRLALLLAVLVVLAAMVVVAYALLSARASIYNGIHQIDLARSQLSGVNNSASANRELNAAIVSIRRAHRDFAAADARLGPLSPVLTRLGWVPAVGSQLAAAAPAARLASTTTEGLLVLLQGVRPVVHAAHQPAGGSRLARLSRTLAAQTHAFNRAYALFSTAMAQRRDLPATRPPQLASALRTINTDLPPLRAASLSLSLAPRLLGVPAARTYLIAYQDPMELRATGGFIGSIGVVTLHGGVFRQHFEGSEIGNREKLLVPAPEPIRLYNEIWWLLRDSNWSPNFPTTADLERYFMRMDLGVNPSGVINVTPQAAAAALSATGPLYVPEYHRTVTADNVAQLADYYTHVVQYRGGISDTARKQFIAIVGQHLLSRIQTLDAAGWLRLASSLQGAVLHGDILVDFPNAREEQMAQLLGAAGTIDPTPSDYLYVVDSNLSYNKINPYVHESTTYRVTVRPNGWLDSRLSIRIWNQPEPADKMIQGAGPGGGTLGGPDDYADFIRIYVPDGAQLVEQSGWTDPWTPGPAYGKTEFSGYVIVRRGHTTVIRLHYIVPPNVFTWSGGRRYRLVVQHQPGSHPDATNVSIRDPLGTQRRRTVNHPDRTWSLTMPVAPRAIQPIPLPPQPKPVVAPGHWLEMHLYLNGPHV